MPVLTIDLNLTEREADRIVALLYADAHTECGTAAYVEGKVAAARAVEADREARALHNSRLMERIAEIRAKAEA